MDKIKNKFLSMKQLTTQYTKKQKRLGIGIGLGVVILAIVIALVLNHKNYTVLFSSLTSDEGNAIVAKLKDDGIEYQYKDNGDILVLQEVADEVRAELVYAGYPESGFTYDIFINNAGGMTTDTEKQVYKIYDLQERIGATIRCFDGVKDAKVTIALVEEQKYVLEDEKDMQESSASVIVLMDGVQSLDRKQGQAIQRLVAKSVPGMQMENVAVFDNNGVELSTVESTGVNEDSQEIALAIENTVTSKIMNVLVPFFGAENVRVSVRASIDMEKVIRESTTYSTPDKIDEQDKTGILDSESGTNDIVGGTTEGGVVGTEENADVPQYNIDEEGNVTGTVSEVYDKDYLVNQIKEQGEVSGGVVSDMSVAVSINNEDTNGIQIQEIKELIRNAAGMEEEIEDPNITVVTAPFMEAGEDTEVTNSSKIMSFIEEPMNLIILAAGLVALLIFIIVISIILRTKKKKKQKRAEEALQMMPTNEGWEDAGAITPEKLSEMQKEMNRAMEGHQKLRDEIRDFTDDNPEITAQLIKEWIGGGDQSGR